MSSRCLFGHLLITFAFSSQPSRRGEVVCAVQLAIDMQYSSKTIVGYFYTKLLG